MKHLSYRISFLLIVCIITLTTASAQNPENWKQDAGQAGNTFETTQWLLSKSRDPNYASFHVPILETAYNQSTAIQNDTLAIKALTGLGYYYQTKGAFSKAWAYYQKAKLYSLQHHSYGKIASIVYQQCQILTQSYLPDSLIHYVDRNRPLIQLSKDETKKLYIQSIYAGALQQMKKNDKALAAFYQLLPIAIEKKDSNLIMPVLMNIAELQSDFDSCVYFYKKALTYAGPRGGNPFLDELYAESLFKIANKYNDKDDARQDSALHYFLEAEKNIQYMYPPLQVALCNYAGNFFTSKGETQLALSYYRKAYNYSSTSMIEEGDIAAHNIASIYIKARMLDSAAYYLTIYKERIDKGKNGYHGLVAYYQTMAEYEEAKHGTCSKEALLNHEKALLYLTKEGDNGPLYATIIKMLRCLKDKPAADKTYLPIALSVLSYSASNYVQIKQTNQLVIYAGFLNGYAALEARVGNKDKALTLYAELADIESRINELDYEKGKGEALVKYKSELKDAEIALLTEQEKASVVRTRFFITGLIGVILVSVLIFMLYRREHKSKQILDERNHKVEQLLREIHHRVKNNLQIVSSFINIQLDKLSEAEHPTERQALLDTSTRIMALAGLHHSLYRQEDLSKIQLSEYLTELCEAIGGAMNRDISIHCDIDNLQLDIDHAIPIGLAANELITNAIKHAFSRQQKGDIWVGLKKADQWELTVKDNGKGIPEHLDPASLDSIGISLVQDIAETQLKGIFSYFNDNGAVFKIEFTPAAA